MPQRLAASALGTLAHGSALDGKSGFRLDGFPFRLFPIMPARIALHHSPPVMLSNRPQAIPDKNLSDVPLSAFGNNARYCRPCPI